MKLEESDTTGGPKIHGLWNSSYPRKGWIEVDVIDTGDFPGGECEFCDTEYRYEHKLYHPFERVYATVGVVCAEKLTNDYVNPRKKESKLDKRRRWIKSPKWKLTENGNFYRKDDQVLVFKSGNKWKLKINDTFGKKVFNTKTEALNTAFDYLYAKH